MTTIEEAEKADQAAFEERMRLLFAHDCNFVAGAVSFEGMPAPTAPEIAFAGRSNVGKSSLINALTGRKTLARVSHTPGRTQQINFFSLDNDRLRIVDLPGYGYAQVSKTQVASWTETVRLYLRGRVPLRRVMLLIDGRHGIKPNDKEIMELLDRAAVPYRIVLTKSDKVKKPEMLDRIEATRLIAKEHPAALPDILVTSSSEGHGIDGLRAEVARVADLQ